MRKLHVFRALLLLLAGMLAVLNVAAAPGSVGLLHSLFDPSTNAQAGAQQGYSVAIASNLVVVGVPGAGVVNVYDATTGALRHTLTNPNPAQVGGFGSAVVVSGARVVVGTLGVYGIPRSEAYVFDLAGVTPTASILRLTNGLAADAADVGTSVAISGEIVAVGAPYGDTTIEGCGTVNVYDLAGAFPGTPVLTLTNPGADRCGAFGTSVAISNKRLVVGAPRDSSSGPGTGISFVFDLEFAPQSVPVLTLTNPIPEAGNLFGSAVAISGRHVAVGAVDYEFFLLGPTAYVYDVDGDMPAVPFVILRNPDPLDGHFFGGSLALSGTRVVVGSVPSEIAGPSGGFTYVYDLTNAIPDAPVFTLPDPHHADGDQFGHAVAIDGMRMVIGANGDDTGAVNAGSAYVFNLASATPDSPTATLNRPSPSSVDTFGRALSISGTRIIIGAPLDDTGAFDAGRAYLYDLANATPTSPVATLSNSIPSQYDGFGWSVAIEGNRAVVGAPGAPWRQAALEHVNVYDFASASPSVPVVTLTYSGHPWIGWPGSSGRFGSAVAIAGSLVVVGATEDSWNFEGSAFVYDLASATPSAPVLSLFDPDAIGFDKFGFAVAISGSRVVVGEPGTDFSGFTPGKAYVYDLASLTPTSPALVLTNPHPAPGAGFGNAVAISGTRVVVGEYPDYAGVKAAGSAYVYDLMGNTPSQPVVTLTNPVPATSHGFGASVAISGTRVVIGSTASEFWGLDMGNAYVYDLASPSPEVPLVLLSSPVSQENVRFGMAVGVEGTTVIAGAPFMDTTAPDRGAAYVFSVGPTLRLATSTTGLITLSWTPVNSPGFVLQYSESLAPMNWVTASTGAANPVTVATTNAARFYRVAQP